MRIIELDFPIYRQREREKERNVDSNILVRLGQQNAMGEEKFSSLLFSSLSLYSMMTIS
jgi:hypothetical protein